jgi:hypothetical protein
MMKRSQFLKSAHNDFHQMEAGKQASRCNAVRHGLTAETVIGALEIAEDYKPSKQPLPPITAIGCGAGARAPIGQSAVAATTAN